MSAVRNAMHGENSAGIEATRRRRQSLQRSTTLPLQPTLPEQDEEDDDEEANDERSRLIQPVQIRTHGIESPNSGSSVDEMERSDDDAAAATARHSFLDVAPRPLHQQRHSAPAASEALRPSPSKRTHFKQRSISVYNTHESSGHHSHEGIKKTKLGRAPSTPSVLLSKVKERIREKVYQASTEWPNAAAIVQERRQRAVESYEAKLSRKKSGEVEIEQIPLKDLHSKKKRGRMRYDPIPVVVATSSKDSDDFCPCDSPQPSCSNEGPSAARLAFRRRSISEDTYDRPLVQHPAATAAYRNSSDSGVICSSMDLKAMKSDFNKRRSPRPSKQDLRSLSVDQTKLLDSQNSMESVSSGYSAQSSVSAGKYDAEVDEGLTSDTPSEYSSQMRPPLIPRIVGDGGQNVTLQNATLLYGSLDESSPANQDDTLKPIPEIVFDAQGQTWDVYGAEFDPEVLGEAIQSHLVRLMLSKTDSMDSESSDKLCQSPTILSDDSDSENRDTRSHRGVRQSKRGDKSGSNANFLVRLLCLFSNRHEPEVTS